MRPFLLPSLIFQWSRSKIISLLPRVLLVSGITSLIWTTSLVSAPQAQAVDSCGSVYDKFSTSSNLPPIAYELDTKPNPISMTFNGLTPNASYKFICYADGVLWQTKNFDEFSGTTDSNGAAQITLDGSKCFGINTITKAAGQPETRHIYVEGGKGNCIGPSYIVKPFTDSFSCDGSEIDVLYKGKESSGCVELGDAITYSVSGITTRSGEACSFVGSSDKRLYLKSENTTMSPDFQILNSNNCSVKGSTSVISDGNKVNERVTFKVTVENTDIPGCNKSIPIESECTAEERLRKPITGGNTKMFYICDQIKADQAAFEKCKACSGDPGDLNASTEVRGVRTAIGCIKNDPKVIIKTIVTILVRISGGLSVLLILASAYTFATSAGDAKKHDDAKEKFFRAIVGPIVIIMSVTIIQFIGVTIFHIPGFGS